MADTPTSTTLADLPGLAAAIAGSASPAVVRIGRHGGRGCGMVVADGHVLTNAHNLRDRTTEVTFADGRRAQGEVTAMDADGDLVVLAVDTGEVGPLSWAEEVPPLGSLVVAVARAAGGGERLTFGTVSGVERAFRGPRGRRVTGSLEHTAPLARGSSGSALVDVEGRLVGLNTARLGDGFYLALPADDDLRQRVEALVAGDAPRRVVLGVGLARAEVSGRLRASVGLPPRAGLLVRDVAEGSAAARAGLQVGDLLTAVDGTELASVDDLHAALDAARTAGTVTLHLVRGTDDLDVPVFFDTEGSDTEGSDTEGSDTEG
ncbi:MAG TPA: trypsin-like peptidase domain-containing protein [Acidimicrobiales bacterium]|nr:trypsin-like peptidase domain-containing protein [Acidimicrobiales bacterium]